jgi:hypothetical protein
MDISTLTILVGIGFSWLILLTFVIGLMYHVIKKESRNLHSRITRLDLAEKLELVLTTVHQATLKDNTKLIKAIDDLLNVFEVNRDLALKYHNEYNALKKLRS